MRYLIAFVILITDSFVFANAAYEIPRSFIFELREAETGRVYPIFIKVPQSYGSNFKVKYPVIYLTDANANFQTVSGMTRFPMNSGVMQEAIIVGISYSKESKGPTSRIRDYTPKKAKDWNRDTGNAFGHAKFIRDVVFPYMESNFRAKSTERTFVGHSLGGLFGAYILFSQPDMFSNYILSSPSVWFNNNCILSESISKIESKTKVYLSVGALEAPEFGEKQDMISGARNLARKIEKFGNSNVTLKFSTVEGASHAIAFPTIAIHGLVWVYSVTTKN